MTTEMTLAITVPRSVRIRLAALQLARGRSGDRLPPLRALILEALDDLFAKNGSAEPGR